MSGKSKYTVLQRMMAYTLFCEETGCWIWTGSRNSAGYGQVSIKDYPHRVHRVSHEEFLGPIPSGFEVHHLCNNPLCWNPGHLEALHPTIHGRLNKVAAAKIAQTHCKHGHEFTPENTKPVRGGRGRQCRTCYRREINEWYYRHHDEQKKKRMDKYYKDKGLSS